MDSARRVSQCKTTKGWLNPPYSRCGCLRIRKRIQADDNSTKKLTTQPGKQVASAYYILFLRLLLFPTHQTLRSCCLDLCDLKSEEFPEIFTRIKSTGEKRLMAGVAMSSIPMVSRSSMMQHWGNLPGLRLNSSFVRIQKLLNVLERRTLWRLNPVSRII